MPARARVRLTIWLTWRKIRGSPLNLVLAAGFPGFLAWLWRTDAYETALKLFFILCPYVFLILSRDPVLGEVRSGVLENVVFAGGEFRRHLALKPAVVSAFALAYVVALFVPLAAWGAAAGRLPPDAFVRFLTSLAVGAYYAALGCLLGHVLEAGSNVLVVVLAQGAVVVTLLVSAARRSGFLDFLSSGEFPDLLSRAKFALLAAAFPNVVLARPLRPHVFEILALAGAAAALGTWASSRRELRR